MNAKFHEREAQIVAQAGREGAVTIATNMAGRGTDILLGGNPDVLAEDLLREQGIDPEEATAQQLADAKASADEICQKERQHVLDAGGLCVIGTERHESRRIDNQLRGRSGRQGDPGETEFYLSLEDDLMKNWGPDWIQDTYQDYDVDERIGSFKPLTRRKYKNLVERAQNASESSGQASRRMTLEFAESMNIQRDLVYKERDRLIKQKGRLDHIVDQVLGEVFSQIAKSENYKDSVVFYRYILDNVSYQVDPLKARSYYHSMKMKEKFLWNLAQDELKAKYEILGTEEVIAQFQRMAILKAIDENWVEQVDYLQQLRTALSGQYTVQKNPLVEFFQEAYQSFDRMKTQTKEQIIRNLLLSRVEINNKGEIVLHFP